MLFWWCFQKMCDGSWNLSVDGFWDKRQFFGKWSAQCSSTDFPSVDNLSEREGVIVLENNCHSEIWMMQNAH